MVRSLLAILLAMVCCVAQAEARSIRWTYVKSEMELSGYPSGEEEPDYVLRLTCRAGAKVEIGIGAHDDIGRGRSGTFSVTLKSGDRTATLSGKSALSKNSEMTGASELRARMSLAEADLLLAVLASGLPIAVTGPKKDTWSVNGLAGKVRAFSEGCAKR
ncbi:MAG: hypothetical protein AB7I42_18340 [Bradyrhizobium sp.]|uniref:hypothetical protein n=1 Tax=Bradyrhizobium sp. TaxID=376 RepID=UPI002A2EF72C|nr:hypothetical protein [Bradyrhizobium sp.]